MKKQARDWLESANDDLGLIEMIISGIFNIGI